MNMSYYVKGKRKDGKENLDTTSQFPRTLFSEKVYFMYFWLVYIKRLAI